MYVHYFVKLSQLGKERGPAFEFSLPMDALCHVWLKLAQWIWRIRIFDIFSLFRILSPFGKGRLFKQIIQRK